MQRYALQNMARKISATYVLVEDSAGTILAYYSISSGQIERENISSEEKKRPPKYPIPVIRLGKLAIDKNCQKSGYGRVMLVDALKRSMLISEQLGVYAIEVHALNEHVRKFYMSFGFQQLEDDLLHLYMPLATVKNVLTTPSR